MTTRNPIEIGAALAITVGVGYAICTLLFWLFPEAAASFMNALFHGLDFRRLSSPGSFTVASFAYGLAVMVAWAFGIGTLFGWLAGRLHLPA